MHGNRRPDWIRLAAGALGLASALAGAAPAAEPAGTGKSTRLTSFTVTERSGVARENWPVTGGVPIPPGAAPENARFILKTSSGRAVPAQFEITGRWWMDNSPRWVLVNFQTSMPAGGAGEYVLSLAERAAPVETSLRVSAGGDVTVVTGPLKFTVRGAGFNLVENVFFDPAGRFPAESRVIGTHRAGALVKAGGEVYRASAGTARLTVEERGPLRAVVRAEGRHKAADGSPGLDYVARIYAYSGKPFVRIEYSFMNRQGADSRAHLALEEVSLVLPTTLAGSGKPRAVIGGAKTVHTATAPASIRQTGSDQYVLGGALSGTVKSGRSDKTRATGWAALSGKGLLLGGAVRWFWQNAPKEIAVGEDGTLTVRLYSGRYDIYQGVGKTHDVYFYFGEPSGAERVGELRRAIDAPLVLACPPSWYCSRTSAFGQLVESDASLFTAEGGKVLERMDSAMLQGLASMNRRRDGNQDLAPGLDQYGIWDFGDDSHALKGVNKSKETAYWNNCYYCFCNAMILGFARTGNEDFLVHAQECARHLGDMDISHHDPRRNYGPGGPRICPALQHFRSYMSSRPEVHNLFNHLKVQSLYALWYLRGDRRAREVALTVSDHVVTRHNIGAADPKQARSVAHGIFAALAGFELTHDRKYLEAAKRMIEIGMAFAAENDGGYPYGKGSLMAGLMGEAYRDYYFITHDPEVRRAQLELAAWMMKKFHKGERFTAGSMATPTLAQAYAITGDRKYLEAGLANLDRWTLNYNGKRDSKHFAQAFKNSQQFLYYLTKRCKPGSGDEGPWPKSRY
jgi:hypothetical protein